MRSLNISGINSPMKCKQTLTRLQRENMDIICLQVVHIKEKHSDFLKCPKLGKLHLALAQNKKRGITVYIKDWLNSRKIYSDEEGRILIMEITTNYKQILLVTIYVPNTPPKINELDCENNCVIGDFNVVIDNKRDYRTTKKNKQKR